MTKDEVTRAVLEALRHIAPEVDPASLRRDVPIRDQVDIDSMDFLNFLVELHSALKVEIPESAYRDVATLDGCVAYIMRCA